MSENRFTSLDLLKILSMLGVIILHYVGFIGHGAKFAEGTNNIYVCSVLVGLFTYATDTFMIVSGYLLAQRKKFCVAKAIELLFVNLIIRLLIYFFDLITNKASFSVNGLIRNACGISYFIILYIVVYLLSPYINIMLNRISCKSRRILVSLCVFLFSIYPMIMTVSQILTGINLSEWSSLGKFGNQDGYSITVFILMYIIGAAVRLDSKKKGESVIRYIVGLIICVIANSFIFLIQNRYQFAPSLSGYYNPFTVMGSLCLLKIFTSFKINIRWLKIVLQWFSEGTLVVLLASGTFLEMLDVEKYAQGRSVMFLLHILISSCLIYVFCIIIWFIYKNTFGRFINFVIKKIPSVTI